ncbi:hypothetical protein COB18_00610 [Candidatus Kaiserbacteria bacterium]|nr:MAG: hypothetical protein COB18_00610 [Candidatus Kaiserbacteria bacterium]
MAIKIKGTQNVQINPASNDFTEEVVPLEYRTKGLNIFFIWIGFILVVASMSFGGGLAAQMTLPDLAFAIISGNIFLALVSFITGYIGSKSGLSFGSLAAKVFGKGTWRVAILYIPLSLVGWYAIEAAIFGNLLADTFQLSDLVRRLVMASAALFFSISAYFGMRFMGKVSYILVPVVLGLSLFALINVDQAKLVFAFSDTKIDAFAGTAIVMSTWIFSALLVIPDLTRFIKNPITAGLLAAVGVFIANSIALGIGAFAAAYTQQYDPSLILVALGFTPLAIILSFAGIWSTNDNNMYSSALSVAKSFSLERRNVVLSLAIIGAIIAFFNPATISIMFSFLVFMSASAPPLAGVVLGAYVFGEFSNTKNLERLFAPWAAWIFSSVIVFQIQGILVIPAGVFLGFFFWWRFSKIEKSLRDSKLRKIFS